MISPTTPVNPVVLMLKNTESNTYHPIYYWECPRPSETLGSQLRWKSKGHHPTGFLVREDAVNEAMRLCKGNHENLVLGDVYFELDEKNDIEWDGKGIPADTQHFNLSKLTKFTQESVN